MTKEVLLDNVMLYHFEPGEKARVKHNRYYRSERTPMWVNQYIVTVVRNNKNSVTVRFEDYENEMHYIDHLDLVPV